MQKHPCRMAASGGGDPGTATWPRGGWRRCRARAEGARGGPLWVPGAPQLAAGRRLWAGAGCRGVLRVRVLGGCSGPSRAPHGARGRADSRLRGEGSERKPVLRVRSGDPAGDPGGPNHSTTCRGKATVLRACEAGEVGLWGPCFARLGFQLRRWVLTEHTQTRPWGPGCATLGALALGPSAQLPWPPECVLTGSSARSSGPSHAGRRGPPRTAGMSLRLNSLGPGHT